ncbi:hypothetical protein ACH5RR_018577 [Cinchona calisaya]|uniref:Uncharacterized protein n=1 Tax=Cinchona calisaya TaxID=153742 RepID=A0ABD2ZS02_9GENT
MLEMSRWIAKGNGIGEKVRWVMALERRLSTAIKLQEEPGKIGYGITASDNRNRIKQAWAVVEKRKGFKEVQETDAIKWALFKAQGATWKKIQGIQGSISQMYTNFFSCLKDLKLVKDTRNGTENAY